MRVKTAQGKIAWEPITPDTSPRVCQWFMSFSERLPEERGKQKTVVDIFHLKSDSGPLRQWSNAEIHPLLSDRFTGRAISISLYYRSLSLSTPALSWNKCRFTGPEQA